MERFDAIVAGAGPAGSLAAYLLADEGASVLLADRARFPRDKPCGGGLTMRAVRQLPYPVDPVVEDVVDRFEFRLGYRARFERSSAEALCLMTQRRRLDAFLAERAAEAGADFRDGAKVDAIAESPDGVIASVGGTRVSASVLICADGVNGTAARALELGTDHQHGVALEGNISYSPESRARYAGRMVLELGTVPGGYAWVFPKGDHLNVGVGGWLSEGPQLRDHLSRLCAAHGLSESRITDLRGYRLPMRRPSSPLARGRVLLVGDAAGLVDPLTGDGMYEAFVSARLGAAAVLDLLAGRTHDLGQYGTGTIRAVASLASTSWGAKVAFDRFPRVVFAIARTPPMWGMVEKVIRGDLRSPGEARGPVRVLLRGVEALARRAGDPGAPFKAVALES